MTLDSIKRDLIDEDELDDITKGNSFRATLDALRSAGLVDEDMGAHDDRE